MRDSRVLSMLLVVLLAIGASPILAQETTQEPDEAPLAARAAKVLERQIGEHPNRRIPRTLREEALCVGVFPSVVKAGFIVAGKRGNGLVSCRSTETGEWGAPAVFTIGAASVGLQAGIQSASIILLFLKDEAVERIATGDKKLAVGIDLDVTAGPVGGTASLDSQPAILSYTRTQGLFAGLDLEGASMGFAPKRTAEHYDSEVSAREVLLGEMQTPESLTVFRETLEKYAAGSS